MPHTARRITRTLINSPGFPDTWATGIPEGTRLPHRYVVFIREVMLFAILLLPPTSGPDMLASDRHTRPCSYAAVSAVYHGAKGDARENSANCSGVIEHRFGSPACVIQPGWIDSHARNYILSNNLTPASRDHPRGVTRRVGAPERFGAEQATDRKSHRRNWLGGEGPDALGVGESAGAAEQGVAACGSPEPHGSVRPRAV